MKYVERRAKSITICDDYLQSCTQARSGFCPGDHRDTIRPSAQGGRRGELMAILSSKYQRFHRNFIARDGHDHVTHWKRVGREAVTRNL
jgi:hypothetical protein